MSAESHCQIVLENWRRLQQLSSPVKEKAVVVRGKQLTLADVVAVARYGTKTFIDDSPELREGVDKSVRFLKKCVDRGEILYGRFTLSLMVSVKFPILIAFAQSRYKHRVWRKCQHTNKRYQESSNFIDADAAVWHHVYWRESISGSRKPNSGHGDARLMGASIDVGQVQYPVEAIAELLNRQCTPLVPLRGSISASGDLSPLSYIAGVLEGNPKLLFRTNNMGTPCKEHQHRGLVPADKLLAQIGMEPISFGPKEGLGLINGTAVSAAVGAMALHETHHLAVLSQVLTAMAVEVMSGSPESFDPFIAQVRPHVGQLECAANINRFLHGSRLTQVVHSSQDMGTGASPQLRQDRYALRTSSQWMGPLLEDLNLAHKQVTVELNSTTDNPLIDTEREQILHGGNFQAMSVTVAMEKARSALQIMSKMLFAQCTEMIHPDLNNGLPPNLCFDEPSLSYCLKGVDIGMAAYTSELGFLAHSVGPNVQSAEMSNQAINSLALISARYTQTAIDVFSMLAASYIYVLCQGLDLRVLQLEFFNALQPSVEIITNRVYGPFLTTPSACDNLNSLLWTHITSTLKSSAATTKDSQHRFAMVAEAAQSVVVTFFASNPGATTGFSPQMTTIHAWVTDLSSAMAEAFRGSQMLLNSPQSPTSKYLGLAARIMYQYVRHTLNIPLNRGLVDHPTAYPTGKSIGSGIDAPPSANEDTQTIGTYITRIYEALRSEALMAPVMGFLAQSEQNGYDDVTAKGAVGV
ncbi:L-Aspartase-like protein [Penicillium nucicola]|uniref:L-Aspartase-like protein n=1 Tax=Penicillium nucicola TaxID=1850975 RepID=UPI0025453BE1|nr:L-Aspartase-like protein [Penicillium nucicola]KAJ5770357.1 L-Aspartase-like protein [Penicillium nucicola]